MLGKHLASASIERVSAACTNVTVMSGSVCIHWNGQKPAWQGKGYSENSESLFSSDLWSSALSVNI